MPLFKGYGMMNVEEQQARWRSRKRIIIMSASLVSLVVIVVAAIAIASRGESGDVSKSMAASATSSSGNKTAATLRSICNVTLYPSSCFDTLYPLVNSAESLDPGTIFHSSVQVAINQLEMSSKDLGKIKLKNETHKIIVQALRNCEELMVLSLERLNDTIGTKTDFTSRDIVDSLKTWLSSVITYQDTCIDGFQGANVDLHSLIKDTVHNSTHLSSNSLAILTNVAKFLEGINFRRRRRLLGFNQEVVPSWAKLRMRKLLKWDGGFEWNGEGGSGWYGGGDLGNNGWHGGGNEWNGYKDGNENGWNGDWSPWKDGGNHWPGWNPGHDSDDGGNDDDNGRNGGSEPPASPPPKEDTNGTTPNLVVAADGSGDYKTIGEAVAAAPDKSKTIYVIYVKEGTYVEKVLIGSKKRNILMYGDGMDKTIVSGSLNVADGTPTYSTATFAVKGTGFVARDMGFRNTAGAEKHQAVAMMCDSDLAIFYRCRFEGYQDTLYVHSGRQFYKECDVHGTVDFIFGNAATVLQSCNIMPRKPMEGQFDTITAQGRSDPNQNTGISIHMSKVWSNDDLTGVKTYLGRPWKEYATTVFMVSNLADFIHPKGWMPWKPPVTPPDTIFYGEYRNTGPGADIDGRVDWKGVWSVMSTDAAKMFTVRKLLEGDWIARSGVPYEVDL